MLNDAGEEAHEFVGDEVLRGFGVPTVKSDALLSVSVQPFEPLSAAIVLLGDGVGPDPSKQFVPVPYPTKSTIAPPVGQEPVRSVVLFSNATLPVFEPIEIVPVTSGVGRKAPFAPPEASWMRK